MKKILKSRIFYFILGLIVASGISTVLAYSFLAPDVGFTPRDDTWEVGNVKDALDNLYNRNNSVSFSINAFTTTGTSIYPSNFKYYSRYMITGVDCYNGASPTIVGTNNWSNFYNLQTNYEYKTSDYIEVYFRASKSYCNVKLKFY